MGNEAAITGITSGDVECSGEGGCSYATLLANYDTEVTCTGKYACVGALFQVAAGQSLTLNFFRSYNDWAPQDSWVNVICMDPGSSCTIRCGDANKCTGINVYVTDATENSLSVECVNDNMVLCDGVQSINGLLAKVYNVNSRYTGDTTQSAARQVLPAEMSHASISHGGHIVIPTLYLWLSVAVLVVLVMANFVVCMMRKKDVNYK